MCLLDPYKLTLDWKVVQEAGSMRTLDIFVNFPIHDINRTVLHHRPENVSEANMKKMNAFWGDESWNALAYDKNLNLFGEVDLEKVSNPRFAEEYRKRLQNVAGFKRVPAPLPMRNSKGSTVYTCFLPRTKVQQRKSLGIFSTNLAGNESEHVSPNSQIEWTDATWNPVRGCTKISPGCKHCYAETFAERFRGVKGHPYEQGFDLRLVPEKLNEPFQWRSPKLCKFDERFVSRRSSRWLRRSRFAGDDDCRLAHI